MCVHVMVDMNKCSAGVQLCEHSCLIKISSMIAAYHRETEVLIGSVCARVKCYFMENHSL